jgi:hypothetical protein
MPYPSARATDPQGSAHDESCAGAARWVFELPEDLVDVATGLLTEVEQQLRSGDPHQPEVPGPPLNGPTTLEVIQPP